MDRSPQDDVPAPNPWVDLRDDGPAGRNLTHVELPVVDVFGPPSPRIGRRRGVSVAAPAVVANMAAMSWDLERRIGLEQSGLSPDVGGRSESGWEIVQLNARNGELSSEIAVTCKHSRGVLRVEPRRQLEALLSRPPHHSQAYRKYCELPSAAALKRDEFGPLSGLPGASWAAEVAEVWAGSPARSPATLGACRRRLGPGDGTPTSNSNVALVSDGEYIVNAKGASKNRALLAAVNSGKAPKFSGSSQAGF